MVRDMLPRLLLGLLYTTPSSGKKKKKKGTLGILLIPKNTAM
jgi:hypothetical protein